MNYFDKEKLCQDAFDAANESFGPFWHICTPGDRVVSINETDEDYRFSVSNLAISAAEAGVVVVTDQVMSNHLHSIMGGEKQRCLYALDLFKYRQIKYLRSLDRPAELHDFRCDNPILIDSLEAMRNEIVYVNRNGFLVDPNMTPFSYPWGGGSLYFNSNWQELSGIPANQLSFKAKRKLTFRSSFNFPDTYRYAYGMILPCSYVDHKLGQSFYRDAHHYLSMLTRNFESYGEVAKRIGDKIVVTDEEMFSVVKALMKSDVKNMSPSTLPYSEKMDFARTLHFDYRASNQQIRRILKIDLAILNEMFPPIRK